MIDLKNTRYNVQFTSRFKKEFKKVLKQGKDENLFLEVLDNTFKDCYECHIQPDWLLVYKVQNNELVLLLFATGSHSDLFRK